jgi:hypothetical protein
LPKNIVQSLQAGVGIRAFGGDGQRFAMARAEAEEIQNAFAVDGAPSAADRNLRLKPSRGFNEHGRRARMQSAGIGNFEPPHFARNSGNDR